MKGTIIDTMDADFPLGKSTDNVKEETKFYDLQNEKYDEQLPQPDLSIIPLVSRCRMAVKVGVGEDAMKRGLDENGLDDDLDGEPNQKRLRLESAEDRILVAGQYLIQEIKAEVSCWNDIDYFHPCIMSSSVFIMSLRDFSSPWITLSRNEYIEEVLGEIIQSPRSMICDTWWRIHESRFLKNQLFERSSWSISESSEVNISGLIFHHMLTGFCDIFSQEQLIKQISQQLDYRKKCESRMYRQMKTDQERTDVINNKSELYLLYLLYFEQCYPLQIYDFVFHNKIQLDAKNVRCKSDSVEDNNSSMENGFIFCENIIAGNKSIKDTVQTEKAQTSYVKEAKTTEKLDIHSAGQVQIIGITKVQTLDTEKILTLETEKVQTLDTDQKKTLDTEKVQTLDTEQILNLYTEKVQTSDTENVLNLDSENIPTLERERVPTVKELTTLDTGKVQTLNTAKVPNLDTEKVTKLANCLSTISNRNSNATLQGEFADLRKEKNIRKTQDNHMFPRESDEQRVIRDNTWLDKLELPVPEIDLTVAYKEYDQTVVSTPQSGGSSETIPHYQSQSNPTFEPLLDIMTKIADGNAPGPQVTMRYELLRICTLRNYPKDNKPYLIQLAAAGFYYAAEGDEVICYCCGLRRHSWVGTDVPERIHRRINPNCKYLNRKHEFNVPVTYTGTTENLERIELFLTLLNEEPVSSQAVSAEGGNDLSEYAPANPSARGGASTELSNPKHPQHILKSQRISSFQGWPDSLAHTPEIMAEAGFYYAGFGDCVRCYYCGIGLRHWAQEDNPWIEHARWSKNCAFIKSVKGEEFVNLVQMAVQYSQNEEENQATGTSEETTAQAAENKPNERELVDTILKSDPAQSVLELGYQPKVIKKAIEFILKRDGRPGISSQTIMEKVLEYEEAETNNAIVGELAKMDLRRNDNTSGGAEARSTENSSSKVKENEAKLESKDKKKLQIVQGNGQKQSEARTIKEENKKLKEQTLCKICLDKPVCIVFLPCGHLCTCDGCAPAMRVCPICRTDVKGTVKTYMS